MEFNPKLRGVKPDDLAGATLLVGYRKFEFCRNSIGDLYLQACPGRRQIPDGAWDAPTTEEDFPRFGHYNLKDAPTGDVLPRRCSGWEPEPLSTIHQQPQRIPYHAFHAARVFAENVARVTDTVVPSGPAKVSTWASSCWASALTILVPSPVFA
jgi:hypothetical protein